MQIASCVLSDILKIACMPNFVARGISIDSRNIQKGDIFIAINKGHEFVKDAIKAGAILAIISDEKYFVPEKTITVADTKETLKSIGAYIKNQVNLRKLVAITGSVGKTTTKFWLNEILSKKYNSFCAKKNYNTIYGVPLSLCQLEKGTSFGIFEIGSSHSGEISELSRYLEPDIGVITNIYESHIGNFENKCQLGDEKISIIDGIKTHGSLIFDGDSEFADKIRNVAQNKKINTYSVGFLKNNDFYIKEYADTVTLHTPNGVIAYKVSFQTKHLTYITATLLATIYAMELPTDDLLPFFSTLSPITGRGNVEKYTIHGKTLEIINDCYNASPTAMLASLEVLNTRKNVSKIAVIGQMKELGKYERYYHDRVAEKLKSINLEKVFFIGNKNLWEIMLQAGDVQCFEQLDNSVIEKILEIVRDGSIVLLKGSLSIGLDRFVEYVKCFSI